MMSALNEKKEEGVEKTLYEPSITEQNLLDSIPYGVWQIDRQYRYVSFNHQHAERMLATYGSTIAVGKNFLDCITVEADRVEAQRKFTRAFAGEQFRESDQRVGPVDAQRTYHMRYIPLRNAEGMVTGACCVSDDVTKLRLTQMQEREALYRSLFENMGTVILVIDPETAMIVDANPAACDFYGYSHAELTNLTILDLAAVPPVDARERIRKIANGELTYMTLPHRLSNGELRDVEVYLSRRMFKGRRENIAVIHDITARKQAEEALRESEERFSTVFHATHDAISISRLSDSVFIDANDAFCRIFGLSRDEIIGHTSRELQLWKEMHNSDGVEALNSQEAPAPEFEVQFQKSSGILGYMLVSVSVAKISGEDCLLIFGKDISLRKQAEAALQESNVALQKALSAKNEFMSAMSHELRTPLSSILGLSETMQEPQFGSLTDRQLRATQTIEKSGHRLLELINNILDYSNLQSSSTLPADKLCALGDICQHVLHVNEPLAEKKRQRVHFRIHPDEVKLRADTQRLIQMLDILINNAVKFTEEGGEVNVEVLGEREKSQVTIAVRDTGIGIKEEDLPRLFKPFVQLDSRLAREYNGTGLGLALARQLAELSGGSIRVQSTVGVGSCFTITLPWRD